MDTDNNQPVARMRVEFVWRMIMVMASVQGTVETKNRGKQPYLWNDACKKDCEGGMTYLGRHAKNTQCNK